MDEFDHPHGWDAEDDEPKPLTVEEANVAEWIARRITAVEALACTG